MSDYTAYIDEAGDLGVNKGTRWFVLTAVIVAKCDEAAIRSKLAEIKKRLNLNQIHLRKVSDFYKRAFIVRELNVEKFVYMNIIVDTTKIDIKKIPNSFVVYNYVCKYLLQRISWYMRDNGKTCDVMLSARGTSRDGELIDYINQKLLPYPNNSINCSAFGRIMAKTAGSWDLLQLADVCATTMFLAHEENGYGFTTPCFAARLKDHLYRNNKKIDSYGIKYFTAEMVPNFEELSTLKVCAKKERIPGATTT